MTHINPSPSQFPERRKTNPHIYLSRIFDNWILYLIGSFFNISIITFDLTADWLLLRVFSSLWIHKYAQNGDNSHHWNFVAHISELFLAFVVLATIVFAVHVICIVTLFWRNRRLYQSKVDGVSPNLTTFEKCINDLVIAAPLLLHNIPIQIIIFMLQYYINCDFYFIIEYNSILLLAILSTCISCVWRCVLTIWNWGCCDKREAYHNGLILRILRVFNIILLCTVFCFAVFNLILAVPVKHVDHSLDNELVNKRGIDGWNEEDYIVFTMAVDEYAMIGLNESSRNPVLSYNDTSYAKFYRIIRLRDIFSRGHVNAHVTLDDNYVTWMHMFTLLSNTTDTMLSNCTMVFVFENNMSMIEYNVGFRCESMNSNKCQLHLMDNTVQQNFYNDTVSTITYQDIAHSVAMETIKPNINATGSGVMPTTARIIRPYVTLSWKLIGREAPCGIQLVWNTSMPLSHNVC